MKIHNLIKDSKLYTSNVYLVLGEWNAIADVNTLVDVGSDASMMDKIMNLNTGLGKKKIDQVVITHNHSDHSAILPLIIETFHPIVYSFDIHLKGTDIVLKDGDFLRMGEKQFEVIHTPIHSSDSVCLFCKEDGVLFVGDTPMPAGLDIANMPKGFPPTLIKNWSLVKTIYAGHGDCLQK